jgi:hypothetical protein
VTRTDYMRDYMRTRRAKDRTRNCNKCGAEYTPARSDSRYCSNSCRSYAYRSRRTITHEFSPEGWRYADNEYSGGATHKSCLHGVMAGTPCGKMATVKVITTPTRDVAFFGLYCDEHAPSRYDHCTFEAAGPVDKQLRTVWVEREVVIPWSAEVDELQNRAASAGIEFTHTLDEYRRHGHEPTLAETEALIEIAHTAISARIQANQLISDAASKKRR